MTPRLPRSGPAGLPSNGKAAAIAAMGPPAEAMMRRSVAAVISSGWGVALGVTFGGVLPWLSGDWHFQRPLPFWEVAEAAGGLLICVGAVPIAQSFAEFVKARGTPVPVASPPHLVVSGPYRYVRNPIYVGFFGVLLGEVLLFGSLGLLKYTALAALIGLGAVHLYEEPVLARRFGAEYDAYRHAVRAWLPRAHPWEPDGPGASARLAPGPDEPTNHHLKEERR